MSEIEASGRGFLLGAVAVLCLGLGLGIGFAVWGHQGPAVGGPAPQQRQPDGSVVIERRPDVGPPSAPVHAIPKGGTEERRVAVTIVPAPAADCPKPPAVHVDLSLVRFGDGSARVVASSPDGQVSNGLDVPISAAIREAEPRLWAAGVSFAGKQAFGVFVHRDLWRIRAGLEVNAPERGGAEARLLVGVTW